MNRELVEKIAQAVLYEGYILYPYRPSVKNHQRWTFGGLYPRAYCESSATGDAWSLLTECVVRGNEATTLEIKARFLHLVDRRVGSVAGPSGNDIHLVDSVSVNGKQYQRWQEAMERDVSVSAIALCELIANGMVQSFSFPAARTREEIRDGDGRVVVVLMREQQEISGVVEASAQQIDQGVFKLSMRICNKKSIGIPHVFTPDQNEKSSVRSTTRDDALMRTLVSTHAILGVTDGQFVSMIDPPSELKDAVESCRNVGVWPVLVGEQGATDAMLASPIILYDHPQIAPESPGDLFDGGEIDEILSLRIMTLTEDEKRDVSDIDQRADAMLKRTESLAREQLMNLHGTMRRVDSFPAADVLPAWDPTADRPKLPSVSSGGVELHPGDRVRLRPRGGADAFDLMLAGKIATIAVIEQDYEDRIHLAVTVEDDPGADFGVAGKPGHRFFFRPDEVEPIGDEI